MPDIQTQVTNNLLRDIAEELRTANLIAHARLMFSLAVDPNEKESDFTATSKLMGTIIERLDLIGSEDD